MKRIVVFIGIFLLVVIVLLFVHHSNNNSSASLLPVGDSPLIYGLPKTSQELVAKRTPTSKTFQNANGTYTAIIEQGPMHYTDQKGSLQDIQLAFNKQPDPTGTHQVYTSNKNIVDAQVDNNTFTITNPTTGKGIAWIVPVQFTVNNNTAVYVQDGITWTYQLTTTGTKLFAKVDVLQGVKTYSFAYNLIGGAKDLTVDTGGSLIGEGFIIPKVTVIGADHKSYSVSGWTLSGNHTVSFTFDDTNLPQSAYPYVIDPTTTFNVGASGDIGSVYATGSTYPPTSTGGFSGTLYTILDYSGSLGYRDYEGLVRWDTSSLGGATVTSATVSLAPYIAPSNTDSRQVQGEWYSSANWPIDAADYVSDPSNTAHTGTSISSFSANTYESLVLNNPNSNINKSGYTAILWFISGGIPSQSGSNNVSFNSYGSTKPPQLLVTYTLPSTPTPTPSPTPTPGPTPTPTPTPTLTPTPTPGPTPTPDPSSHLDFQGVGMDGVSIN